MGGGGNSSKHGRDGGNDDMRSGVSRGRDPHMRSE